MSPTEYEKFEQRFIRISNSIPLIGCGFSKNIEACVERRLRNAIEYWKGQLEEVKFYPPPTHTHPETLSLMSQNSIKVLVLCYYMIYNTYYLITINY